LQPFTHDMNIWQFILLIISMTDCLNSVFVFSFEGTAIFSMGKTFLIFILRTMVDMQMFFHSLKEIHLS